MDLRPPRGSVNFISSKHTNIVSLEKSHHKSMTMYGGGPLRLALEGDN